MVGMFVSLCLASKRPSEREFFVHAGTGLGVKLLTAMDACPLLDKASLVISNIKDFSPLLAFDS
jgi:hypothetical protein